MKGKLWVLAFLAFGTYSLASAPIPKSVRVKLTRLNFPVQISGAGISIKGIKNSDVQNISIPRTSHIEVDNHKVAGKNLWIIQNDEALNRLSEKYLEITSSDDQIRISGYKFSTPVLLTASGDVIASMPLDTYLEGVLAGEMPTNWPIEALKSQAVAARSYTLYQINQRKNNVFQLEGSILDQVYAFTDNSKQLSKIHRALAETEGLVLMENGQVMKAYYHSDCGGETEDPKEVWGGPFKTQKFQTVVDAHCALNKANKWSFEISVAEMKKKLESSFGAGSTLESVRIISRTPSGRASTVAFNMTPHKSVLVSGNELRKILGYGKLKSTLFTVSLGTDFIKFVGRGFGHGSGLCQWGARYLAEKGATALEILKHYYPSSSFSESDHVTDL